jgi:hypothetical protein
MPAMFHISGEGGYDPGGIGILMPKSKRQIKKVPAFLALIERAQLRSQQLIEIIGGYSASALEPARHTPKGRM